MKAYRKIMKILKLNRKNTALSGRAYAGAPRAHRAHLPVALDLADQDLGKARRAGFRYQNTVKYTNK